MYMHICIYVCVYVYIYIYPSIVSRMDRKSAIWSQAWTSSDFHHACRGILWILPPWASSPVATCIELSSRCGGWINHSKNNIEEMIIYEYVSCGIIWTCQTQPYRITNSGDMGSASGQTAHSKRWKGKGRWTAERRHARNDTRHGQVSAVNPLQMQYIYIYTKYVIYTYTILYHPIQSSTILYHLIPII